MRFVGLLWRFGFFGVHFLEKSDPTRRDTTRPDPTRPEANTVENGRFTTMVFGTFWRRITTAFSANRGGICREGPRLWRKNGAPPRLETADFRCSIFGCDK